MTEESTPKLGEKVVFAATFYGEGLYFGDGQVIPTTFVTENGVYQQLNMHTGAVYLVGAENIRRMPRGN